MANFTEQEQIILELLKKQVSPEQFDKFMKLPEDQIKNQLAQMLAQQASAQNGQECVFCNIVSGKIPSKKVYEDNEFVAFLDINPANPGHTMVVPKKHYIILPQMPDQEVASLFKLVKKMSSAVFDGTGAEGIQIRQNNGPAAGQVVPHIHVHIIPRFKDDGITPGYSPKKVSDEQLDSIAKKIREKIPLESAKLVPETPQEKVEFPPRIPRA